MDREGAVCPLPELQDAAGGSFGPLRRHTRLGWARNVG